MITFFQPYDKVHKNYPRLSENRKSAGKCGTVAHPRDQSRTLLSCFIGESRKESNDDCFNKVKELLSFDRSDFYHRFSDKTSPMYKMLRVVIVITNACGTSL